MFKNVAATFVVFAFDATTNVPKTGDAANITAYVSKDYGTVTVLGDTTATEFDATNAPGYYWFTAAQAETNADCLMVTAKSSTANIKVLGAPAIIYTRPTTGWLAPATAGRTLVVDAAGLADANVVKVGPTGSGTAQTARDIGLSVLISSGTGTGQLNVTSGVIDANVTKWLGTACSTPSVAGVPNVNTKTWNDLATVALPLVPTTAGRTLDVTAANKVNGVVLVDTLTTYTGNTVQTGDSFARIGAAGVGLTAVGLTGTQTFNNTGTWTGNITGNLSGSAGSVTGAVGSVTGAVGSVTGLTASNLDTTISSRLASATYVPPTTALTESYAALHAAPTMAQLLFEIRALLAEKSVAVTTLTAKKIDGSSTAETFTLDSATAPTSITRAT